MLSMEMKQQQYNSKWNELCVKDQIAYIIAMVMIGSGILIAFLSFFLNAFNIATGVLIYIAQTFTVGGSIVGASAYFKSKWMEFDTRADNIITNKVNEIGAKISNKKDKGK